MLLYWMPYLQLSYPHRGPRELRIGNAVFFEDTIENWTTIIQRPRPKHLEIHRDYPVMESEELGDPLFGTLVRSDDDKWLTDHIDESVAVLYFLGDDFRQGRPAECFAYHRLSLDPTTAQDTDLVGYWTKHGYLMESSEHLVLYPPLAVRGNQRAYRIDTDADECKELLRRFLADPHDRLVVAVRQYFRTQFTDTFTSPLAEDYALHCGAIEAALDLDALKPGVSERFVESLAGIYGKHDYFETFFLGLYISRSLFVHGVSSNQADNAKSKEAEAYRLFRKIHCKISLMRQLTRDVICEKLGRKKDPFGFLPHESALPLMATALHSTDTWMKVRSLLTKAKAADHISDMSEDEFKTVEELAFEINNYFDWQCVMEDIEQKQVLKALCTCAILIGRLTNSAGDVYEQSDRLGKAAGSANTNEIESWIFDDPWHDVWLQEGNRLSAIQRIARGLAKSFDKHHLIPWR